MTRKAKYRVLIVDDEPAILEILSTLLADPGREVSLARSAADVESYFSEPAPDVVLLDWKLPDGDGMELLPRIKARWPAAQVILLTGQEASPEVVVEAMKRGAYHFKSKPFSGADLKQLVKTACSLRQVEDVTDEMAPVKSVLGETIHWPVARSAKMKEALRLTARVAPNDICILITGESGTGKEVIANLVHSLSLQAKGPLVKINCAALPRELIESELFGAIKGAYTGSVVSRNGLLAEASGGTLFLDEIAEMPIATQAKLLRVLQYKEFRPVGGTTTLKTNCRIIAATNREVMSAISESHLRADLYYRIGAITLHLAPLRERPEDILPLAELFIRRSAVHFNRQVAGLTPAAADIIQRYPWPGNVRQLENEMQRAVLMCERAQIGASDLSIEQPQKQEAKNQSPLERAEREVILSMLRECSGNKRETARKLGIARPTLYKKLADYGIEVPKPGSDEASVLVEDS